MQPNEVTSNIETTLSPNLFPAGKTRAGILVVEDEEFVREAAAEILESCGYRVFKACSFEDAVQTFQRNSHLVDLLVADIIIPGRNGRELVKTLREISSGLKVLYISGTTPIRRNTFMCSAQNKVKSFLTVDVRYRVC